MKKLILAACVVLTINAKSQTKDTTIHLKNNIYTLKKADSLKLLIRHYRAFSSPQNSYNMPNALANFKDNAIFIGNNKNGFDVYQSQVDNMPVLKPDARNLETLKCNIQLGKLAIADSSIKK